MQVFLIMVYTGGMHSRIRIRNITAVSLSIPNILIGLLFVPIVLEYYHAFSAGYISHLQFHLIPFDVGMIVWGVVMLVYGTGVLVRYFRSQPVPVVMPIVFFLVHMALYASSYINMY